MNKQQLFEILMGAARRANELMVLDRDFDYQLGIDFSSSLNTFTTAVMRQRLLLIKCCPAKACVSRET